MSKGKSGRKTVKEEKPVQEELIQEQVAQPEQKETRKESKPVQERETLKEKMRVILITRDGCIVQDKNGNNHRLYGMSLTLKAIGDIIEV